MSKLEQLMKEFCPNGVENKPLGELAVNCDSMRKPVTKGNRKAGIYPYYGASGIVDYVDGYLFDGDYLLVSEDGANLLARTTPIAFSISGKNWVNNHAHVLQFDNEISRKYVEIYLNSINLEKYISTAAQPKLTKENLNKIVIPFPPLEIQTEIVRILEKYSASVRTLQQELEKELTARKKQYEYYRDRLLDFGVHGATSDCEWRTLKEIAIKVASGKNKEKNQKGAYPVYGSTGVIAYCDKYEYNKRQILIARVGANAGYVHIADGKYDVSDNTLILDVNDSVLFKYIFYLLVNMNLNKFAKGGGQPLVTAGQIKEIKIPIPPIEEQKRIVSILDRFDKLCNDISEGLPAEIEARRKQYEYYRDKLLSFEEKKNA